MNRRPETGDEAPCSGSGLLLRPIGHIRTPYREKFAVPRQPNLVPQAVGEIHFEPDFADPNSLRGIEQFSHLWLIFAFHQTAAGGWSPLVQPPRLGGRERIGVFASRSTFRPNPVGMSAVRYLDWTQDGRRLVLRVSGVDLVDGTPILDIKPYVPYADALPGARAGYASEQPDARQVQFSSQADIALQTLEATRHYPDLRGFITAVLAQDPRPAWRRRGNDDRVYGMSLYDLNIRWLYRGEVIEVQDIAPLANAGTDDRPDGK